MAATGIKLKQTDAVGFIAILVAGFIIGKDWEKNDFTAVDFGMIVGFLILGFYLAVILS